MSMSVEILSECHWKCENMLGRAMDVHRERGHFKIKTQRILWLFLVQCRCYNFYNKPLLWSHSRQCKRKSWYDSIQGNIPIKIKRKGYNKTLIFKSCQEQLVCFRGVQWIWSFWLLHDQKIFLTTCNKLAILLPLNGYFEDNKHVYDHLLSMINAIGWQWIDKTRVLESGILYISRINCHKFVKSQIGKKNTKKKQNLYI